MDKESILRTVTRNYSAMVATLLGLTFGLGFVLGDVFSSEESAVALQGPKTLAELDTQFAETSQKYAHHKLAYYDRLHKKPAVAPIKPPSPPLPAGLPPVDPLPQVEREKMHAIQEPESKSTIAEALSNVLGDSAPSPVKVENQKLLPTSTGSPYAIQVGSFFEKDQAQRLSQKLLKNGHASKIVRGELDDDRVVFRVRIHGFEDKTAAVDYLVRNQGVSPGFDFGFIITQ